MTSRIKILLGVAVIIVTGIVLLVLDGNPGGGTPFSTKTTINLLTGGWNYVPGATANASGVTVHYLGRAIVQQDGSAGQPNPPVNSYGTHLKVSGDFDVSATMKNIAGTASLQLYSADPVVQDEFRIEPKSIRLSVQNGSLTVQTWTGFTNQNAYKQTPASTARYPVSSGPSTTLTVQRRNGKIDLIADGKQLGTVSSKDLFDSGTVWFGLDAGNSKDSWTLAALTAQSVGSGTVQPVNTQLGAAVAKSSQGLQQLASQKRPGFLVGAAMALTPAVSDSKYAALAYGGNFGIFTPENMMKWQFIEPQPGIYDFREADALVELAHKNGLAVNGHTLVFGEANPAWVQDLPVTTDADKQHVKQVMIDHIQHTVGHFKGRVASWDVVNEPLADYDDTVSNPDQLREHIWFKAMGEDYIATAFAAAHQADPQAKLYINEYGLEADGDRWNTFLALITKLKAQGVPIDGVGFQSHVYEAGDKIDPAVLRTHIEALAKLGLTSRISEMDVYSDDGTAVQAQQFADVFNACLEEQSCVSWTTWGITDRYDLYLDDNDVLQSGQDFLWNAQAQETPAVAQIRKLLE